MTSEVVCGEQGVPEHVKSYFGTVQLINTYCGGFPLLAHGSHPMPPRDGEVIVQHKREWHSPAHSMRDRTRIQKNVTDCFR